MVNFKIVARAISMILITEGLLMLLSGGVSLIYDENKTASAFLYSAILTIVTGILVFTPLKDSDRMYGTREGYIISTGIYLISGLAGTLPFLIGHISRSFTDAFFESIAGFTATNATVFSDVESLPHGFLFWRSLMQWLGGIAALGLSLYVLPVIRSLNIQIQTSEFSGQTGDKIHPKIIEVAKRIISVYISLTLIEILLLVIGKMPLFDAVCHSLSTLSAGGFSTKNNGISAFSSPFIRSVITLFMFFAGTNISLFYFAVKKNFRKITGNKEFMIYIIMTITVSLMVSALLFRQQGYKEGRPLSDGFFQVVSVLSNTGYYTSDFGQWGSFLCVILLLLMIAGGMSSSSGGGLKIIRLLIVSVNSRTEMRRLIHPFAYLPVRIDKKTVPQNNVLNILIFVIIYCMTVCAGSMVLSLMDYDIITSLSTTISMVGNIGPGIGSFGPFSDFSEVPAITRLFLSSLMVIGRLELLAVLVLVTRSFYRN